MIQRVDVAAIEKAQDKLIHPWVEQGVSLVSGKLRDARVHAEKAVTDILRTTSDGRASAGVIRQSPSFKAAVSRLDELWTAISGASVTSLYGLVQDASVAFYVHSRKLWWDQTPVEFRAASSAVTDAQKAYVRGMLWYGLPIRQDFDPQFKRAKNTLIMALGEAGSTQATNRDGYVSLQTWEGKTRHVLFNRVGLALVDAFQRADRQAMKDSVDPKYQAKS